MVWGGAEGGLIRPAEARLGMKGGKTRTQPLMFHNLIMHLAQSFAFKVEQPLICACKFSRERGVNHVYSKKKKTRRKKKTG